MSHIHTTGPLTESAMIRRVLARLDYTVDPHGIVYLSIEEGGEPIGHLSEISAQIRAYGVLDQRSPNGLHRGYNSAAAARLDRVLFERATRLVAA